MEEFRIKRADIEGMAQAVIKAKPGDKIVYHIGENLLAAGDCGRYAWFLYDKGLVVLVRKRKHANGYFEYIAVRTDKRTDGELKMPQRYRRPTYT